MKVRSMSGDESFPIHPSDARRLPMKTVPYAFLRPHEAQALKNHSQSLERLKERGGLGLEEMYWIIKGLPWNSRVEYANEKLFCELIKFLMEAARDA